MAPSKPSTTASDVTLEEWISQTARLVKLDYDEELAQNLLQCGKYSLKALESSGFAIRKLIIRNTRNAFGRILYQFSPSPAKKDEVNLTTFGITNGDIVGITTQSDTGSKLSGVVLKMTRSSMEVAFDPNAKELSLFAEAEYFNLIKIANDVTYRRLKGCVDHLFKASQNNYLVNMLFGTEPLMEPLHVLPPYLAPFTEEPENEDGIIWFNQNLNEVQREAITFSLLQRHLAIIHGPPGTGKTTTLTEVILQLITRGQKVFVFAPSNVAVDNIFKQLLTASQAVCSRFKLKKPFNFVRLGHPARVDDQLKNYSLDQVVMNSDSSVVSDLRAELDEKTRVGTGGGGGARWHHRGELKDLRQQIAQYEDRAFQESLSDASVIFATVTSATLHGQLKHLVKACSIASPGNSFMFDVAIIDECAQSLEIAAWIPLSNARKAILAGDHKQLPATIISDQAAKEGLSISLIERLVHRLYASCPEKVVRMLTIQYRMNHLIMDWPSEFFYQGKLVAGESVADRRLMPEEQDGEAFPVIRLIDTIGCDMYELELEDSLSKGNKYETDIVSLYIRELLDAGIAPSEIGVISPYRLQTSMIAARCRQQFPDSICNSLEINSVDAFQGREKEVIILSLVRSNDSGNIGFLIEERRLNVAITRARSHLVVVGDSGTVTQESAALKSFMDYCYEHADVITATDYLGEMDKFDELKIEMMGKTKEVNAKEVKSKNMKGTQKNLKREKKNAKFTKKVPAKGKPTPTTAGPTEETQKDGPPEAIKAEATVEAEKKRNEERAKAIRGQLERFLADASATVLKFPEALNSFERRLAHELCAELGGLAHQSVGDHPSRQLIVRKVNTAQVADKQTGDDEESVKPAG